jgi:hypothetical protein
LQLERYRFDRAEELRFDDFAHRSKPYDLTGELALTAGEHDPVFLA